MFVLDPPPAARSSAPFSSSAWPVVTIAAGTLLFLSGGAVAQEAAPLAAPSATAPTAAAPVMGVAALIPHDLSPWSMFLNADIVVKVVMVGLALASLVTWTILLAKGIEIATAKRRATVAIHALLRAGSLADAADGLLTGGRRHGGVGSLVAAAVAEVRRSQDLSGDGIKERLAIALSRQEARTGRDIARGTGILATVGSTSPFIGLFGTVWGIMNAFIGISQSHTTNLAVVAPGIAEALLATACGLVAAIPAVIIYNVFARSIAGYRALMSDASGEILQHLSRDLERQSIAAEARLERPPVQTPVQTHVQPQGHPLGQPSPVRLRSGA